MNVRSTECFRRRYTGYHMPQVPMMRNQWMLPSMALMPCLVLVTVIFLSYHES